MTQELGIAPSTVREYLGRAAAAEITWPLAADVTDESLVARLFANGGVRAGARFHAEPDWAALAKVPTAQQVECHRRGDWCAS